MYRADSKSIQRCRFLHVVDTNYHTDLSFVSAFYSGPQITSLLKQTGDTELHFIDTLPHDTWKRQKPHYHTMYQLKI